MDETDVNPWSKRGSSSPSSPSRQAKRTKQQSKYETHLPAEMWSSVMGYLDFSSVLSMTATSRTMNDAAPLVSELHITKSCQLHGSVGRRFKEVDSVYIYSLTQIRDLEEDRDPDDEDITDAEIDFETSVRAVPFMYTFTNLKRVYFGGINVVSDLYRVVPFHDVIIDAELNEQHFSRLIDSISAGFRCGILSPTLEVNGLLCTRIWQCYNQGNDDPCDVCTRACESFPIRTVAAFECGEGHNDQQPQNCICLEVDDWISLLEFSPGGQEIRSSKAPILELLGQCQRIRLATKDGKSLWFIQFSDRTEMKLNRILQKSSLDVSELDCSEVSGALLQSFATSENDVYILSDVANSLLENFSIRVDEHVFGSQSQRLKIAREILNEMDHHALSECVSLLEALVSQEEPPIQDIIDSGAVLALLEGNDGLTSVGYLRTLVTMLKPKEEHQVAAILDLGLLKHLDHYLVSAYCVRETHEWIEPDMVHMCEALKHIASTSVNTREKLLNSDIIGTLSKFTLNVEKGRPTCTDTLKIIFRNNDMPQIDLNSLKITESTLANICCSRDLLLVEFVISVLDTQIERQQLSGVQSMRSYSSFIKPLRELMSSPSTELHGMKMLSRLSELDYFGSAIKNVPLSNIHANLIQDLESESNELARQACKSTGYVMRHKWKLDTVFSGIIVKYINALVRLSRDGGHLSIIHQRLLLYLQEMANTSSIGNCFEMQKQLDGMTFVELCSLLKCSDSESEVEDELKTFLAKRTNAALEDQIKRCIECWTKMCRCEAHDIMTDDQVKAAARRIPLTMNALGTCGFMDSYDGPLIDMYGRDYFRNKFGEDMLGLMKDYHYAKNWQEYHHCGIFVILYHCALQIDTQP